MSVSVEYKHARHLLVLVLCVLILSPLSSCSSSRPAATTLPASPTFPPTPATSQPVAVLPQATQTLPQATALPRPTATLPLPTATLLLPTATPDAEAVTRAFAQALSEKGQQPFSQALPETPPAGGQPGGPPQAPLNPFVQLFPELRDAPAPAWLQEGTRITYYVQSASIAQAPDQQGSAGAGYLQCDVVALDDAVVVSSVKLYLDMGSGIVIPSLVAPSLGIPGAGDYWLHPDVLRDAERVSGDELTVARMPTQIAGRSYNAVRFEYRPEGAEYVWMFDEESGLLLFYRHAIGKETDPQRQLTDITLVKQRTVKLPWQARAVPAWVRKGGSLRYEGTYSALAMGSPAGSLPYAVTADVQDTFPRWSLFLVTDAVSRHPNSQSWRVTGVAQLFDAEWLPPEALAAVQDGQVLDRDPVTGATVTVSRPRGGPIVLTETGASYYTALSYDGTDGTLVGIEQQVTSGAATTIIKLSLAARQ